MSFNLEDYVGKLFLHHENEGQLVLLTRTNTPSIRGDDETGDYIAVSLSKPTVNWQSKKLIRECIEKEHWIPIKPDSQNLARSISRKLWSEYANKK